MTITRRLEKLEARDSVERIPATSIWKTRKLSTKEWNEAVENGTLRELIKASSEYSVNPQHMQGMY